MTRVSQLWVHAWVRSGRRVLAIIASAVIAALLIGAASIWAFIAPASAEFIGNGIYVQGVGAQNSKGFWLGALGTAHNLGSDEPSYCVSMWKTSPRMADPASAAPMYEQSVVAPEELRVSTAEMAYIMQVKNSERTAESRAAIAYLAHLNFEQPHRSWNTETSVRQLRNVVLEQQPQIEQLAREYVGFVRSHMPTSYEGGQMKVEGFGGTLNGVGVRSASGWVEGMRFTANLEGPAVFVDTQSTTYEGATAAEPATLTWKSTGAGQVKARIVFHGVPRQSISLARAGDNYQDLVTIAARPSSESETHEVITPAVDTLSTFQPQARTNVGKSRIVDALQSGATISDTVEVFMPKGHTWPQVNGRNATVVLHGEAYSMNMPLDKPLDSAPQEAKVLGNARINAEGPGTYTAAISGAQPGFVTWVWRIDKNDPEHQVMTDAGGSVADFIRADWKDRWGILEETSSVRSRMRTDSALSVRETQSGTYLVDDIYVHGLPEDHGTFGGIGEFAADVQHIQQQLLFFPKGIEPNEENLAKATEVGRVRIPARSGFHASVGANEFRVLEGNPAGTYVFVTSFEGDSRVAAYRSDIRDSHEWFIVNDELERSATPEIAKPEPVKPIERSVKPVAQNDTPQSVAADSAQSDGRMSQSNAKETSDHVSVAPAKGSLVEHAQEKPYNDNHAEEAHLPDVASRSGGVALAKTGVWALTASGVIASACAVMGVGMLMMRRKNQH